MPVIMPTPEEIAIWRAENAAGKRALGPGPDMVATRTFSVPGPRERAVRTRLLVPTPQPAGVLIYLHGGGWVTGSIDTFDRLGRALADRSGWAVLLVDYAKAPEHPYPEGLEDAWAVLQWSVAHADETLRDLGTPPPTRAPLIVGGDSSGGNLTAVVACRARDAGLPLAGQLLIYPVTDCSLDRPSHRSDPGGRAHLEIVWNLYCPPERRSEPEASPLRADSLAGLPPAMLVSAENDPLNDEGTAYANRLIAEGVEVTRHRIAGLGHGCLSYWGTQPAADRGLDAIAAWLNRS